MWSNILVVDAPLDVKASSSVCLTFHKRERTRDIVALPLASLIPNVVVHRFSLLKHLVKRAERSDCRLGTPALLVPDEVDDDEDDDDDMSGWALELI